MMQHILIEPESKDLVKKTTSDNILKDGGFDKKKTGSGISVNEQLAEKLHKSVIKKFKTRKVCARFKDNN